MVKINGKLKFEQYEIDDIIKKYTCENKSVVSISKIYGCSEGGIRRLLQSNSVDIKPVGTSCKYTFDVNIFDNIDDEFKAYWIGFIWCDSSNIRRVRKEKVTYEFKLELSNVDCDHVTKFKGFLKSNHNIKKYKYTSCLDPNKLVESTRILISNSEFGHNLHINYGLISNRLDASKVINAIPEELRKHFIRGVIDADGSVVLSNINEKNGRSYKRASVSISTYKDITEFINKTLIENNVSNCESKYYKRHPERDGNCFTITYCGNINAVRILDWLYKDSKIYLDRKYNKYIEIKNNIK